MRNLIAFLIVVLTVAPAYSDASDPTKRIGQLREATEAPIGELVALFEGNVYSLFNIDGEVSTPAQRALYEKTEPYRAQRSAIAQRLLNAKSTTYFFELTYNGTLHVEYDVKKKRLSIPISKAVNNTVEPRFQRVVGLQGGNGLQLNCLPMRWDGQESSEVLDVPLSLENGAKAENSEETKLYVLFTPTTVQKLKGGPWYGEGGDGRDVRVLPINSCSILLTDGYTVYYDQKLPKSNK